MKLLLGSLGLSFASALIPLINIELYLGVVATQVGREHLLWVAVIAGVGQTLGKVVWYVATWKSMESRWMQRRLAKPKVAEAHARWTERAQGRPVLMGVINFSAASTGLPPMLVMAAVAGSVRMSLWVFVPTCLVGRILRFWVILAGVDLLWV